MKEQIQQLIDNYKLSKLEVFSYLEELNQIDSSKLDYKEIDSLRESVIRYEESHYLYSIIITELENLL